MSVYIQKVFRNARWLFNTPVRDIPRGYEMVQVCCNIAVRVISSDFHKILLQSLADRKSVVVTPPQ